MKKNKFFNKKIVSIFLIILILLPNVAVGSDLAWEDFLEVIKLIEEKYYIDVSDTRLLEGATKGLLYYLDEYSEYYTEDEFKLLEENLSGKQTGIGIYITKNKDEVEIIGTHEGGAAQEAGMRVGDIIESIDNKDIKNITMEEIIDMLIGVDGSFITMVVKRGQRRLPFYIQREEMEVKYVEAGIMEDDIGYLKISQFASDTGKEVEKVLKEFDKNKINNIIIDLRGNPGGYLTETLRVADLLIPKGPVVYVKYRDQVEEYISNAKFEKNKYNMVVLVNEESASASEIFAGAVKDRKLGTIVGEKTYGKSKVQEIIKLNRGGIKISTAEYFTPDKINIGGKGITPDIIVEQKYNEDSQLLKAVEIFKK